MLLRKNTILHEHSSARSCTHGKVFTFLYIYSGGRLARKRPQTISALRLGLLKTRAKLEGIYEHDGELKLKTMT